MAQAFKKILVANRGEIAVRVMRTCREMGIPTVAVYSDPDRKALHVRYATEAYHLGPALAKESYLNIEKIIAVAKRAGADAIHPGYGFLSENPAFARAIAASGLTLIGPKAESMEAMSSKTKARQLMKRAGVPVVPGVEEAIRLESDALRIAQEMGFPVMLKACAGGGGKGMRRVNDVKSFSSAWSQAQSEARNSFGDESVYIEKYLDKPRHIEVQVFADQLGHVTAFTERECSVQRRHQKLIEESPSPFVTPDMRKQMAEVACLAAKAVDYVGAGTVEFLVDAQRNFYFMEMNTRLQVEHPVTEMISGLDLVKMQIEVAMGLPLSVPMPMVPSVGWAMEARVCAEDVRHGFAPSPGHIKDVRCPGGPFVRTDTAIYAGSDVTMDYDSMIAKVIAWGDTRLAAIQRLDRALSEFTIKGVTTNTMFLRQILDNKSFVAGTYDTGIVEQFFSADSNWISDEHKSVALLGAALACFEHEKAMRARVKPSASHHHASQSSSNWRWGTCP